MRLIFVGNTSWSMWNFRGPLMLALKSEGHDITIVAPRDVYSDQFGPMGLKYIELKKLARKGMNPFQDLALLWEITSIYRKLRPDLIFHYTVKPNIFGTLGAALARVPSVSVVTGLGYLFINRTWATVLASKLYQAAFWFSTKILFLNQEDKEDFVHRGIIEKQDARVAILDGEGVDTSHFSPAGTDERESVEPAFLFVGRLLIDKGLREFVDAARDVKRARPECRFQILGPVDEGNPAAISRQELESWTNSETIEYLGSSSDVRPFMARCWAFLLPSYLEGMSRVLMEAMAMAKPLITTDVRGCRQFIEIERNGFLVPPRDSRALANALSRFLELDPQRRVSLGRRSRQMALDRYGMSKTIDFYRELIFEINKGCRGG